MFSKFQLEGITPYDFSGYEGYGRSYFENYQAEIETSLQDFIDENGVIDGTKLQNNWFPVETDFDVFLSHSHSDEKTAIALAGFLQKELGLNTFIDSCLWGYSNELLKRIDIQYCMHRNGEMFDYDKRNYSTSHVHMMLSIALTSMIDACETVFLLNTPQSISLEEDIKKEQTSSPWIYHELSTANVMRVKPITDYRNQHEFLEHKDGVYNFVNESASLAIKYYVDGVLQNFLPLTADELKSCAQRWKTGRKVFQSPLDYIYLSKGIISKQTFAD